MGWIGWVGRVGLGWVGLDCGLLWVGLGWFGLGWIGPWFGFGRIGLGCLGGRRKGRGQAHGKNEAGNEDTPHRRPTMRTPTPSDTHW